MTSVTVLIPAHNEQDRIAETIASLVSQSQPPERIVVSLDNCTDETEAICRAMGCEVYTTIDNPHKRAGAINQALLHIEPSLSDDGYLFVLDADTIITPDFIKVAKEKIVGYDGLGPSFRGDGNGRVIEVLQQNEYLRIARKISRRNAKPFLLSGACEFLPMATVRAVMQARGKGGIPSGVLYNYESIAEDWELTVTMKRLGFKFIAPKDCLAWTEVMPTNKTLFRQRSRWQKGYLEVLRLHGFSKVTAGAFAHQAGVYLGTLIPVLWATLVAVTLVTGWVWTFNPILTALFGVVIFERVWSVRRGNWKNMLIAGLFAPELFYEFWKNFVFWKSGVDFIRRTADVW